MVFSESTNKTGMYELFQDLTKTNSTNYTAYKYARDANNALLKYMGLAMMASGKGQVDDLNFTSNPEISINLVLNQFDYPLTSDADADADATANQILDIERIECATESTADADSFQILEKYNDLEDDWSVVASRNISGIPRRFSLRNNTIFLDPKPNFAATDGLRIFFDRTPSYFAGTDTTKVAGIPHSHQEYLVYRPAYLYCITNLPSLAKGYLIIMQTLEKDILEFYRRKNRDERKIMSGKKILYI